MMIPVVDPTPVAPTPLAPVKKSEKDSKQRSKQRKSVTREFVNSEIAAAEGQQKPKKEIPQGQEGNWDVVKLKKPVRRLTLPSNLIARVIGRSGTRSVGNKGRHGDYGSQNDKEILEQEL